MPTGNPYLERIRQNHDFEYHLIGYPAGDGGGHRKIFAKIWRCYMKGLSNPVTGFNQWQHQNPGRKTPL